MRFPPRTLHRLITIAPCFAPIPFLPSLRQGGTTTIVLWLLLAPVTWAWCQSGKHGKYGQFAPPDAYQHHAPLAYYGSENPWNRRAFERSRAARFPKRIGQRLLLLLEENGPQAVVAECHDWLATRPHDAEVLFALTAAHCQAGELDQATQAMRDALDAGLPIERFVAGPRELFRPLVESNRFQQQLARQPVHLVHGPLLGDLTDTSVRIWLRTARACTATATIYSPDNHRPVARATGQTTPESDYTTVIQVTGLAPATRYSYRLTIDGHEQQPTYRFRTLVRRGQPIRFRAAFGGGAGYNVPHERIWATIAKQQVDALFLLGDNVYIDLPQMPGPVHRYTYYRRQSRPEFRQLTANTPVYAIWDDHDCATDDVWMGPYRDRPRWKLPMLRLFQQNWANPAYGTPEWPACWFRMQAGDIDFFFLDGRFYRTNPFGKHPTMLGPVQKKWLLQGLASSRATFKVILSPVPWAPGTKPGSRDTWDGFAEEREAIFRHIEQNRIGGVLLVSADRHRSDAWRIERPAGYPLYDVMSSRLTNIHKHSCIPGSLFCYNQSCAFGVLQFDTTLADPTFRYQIIDIDGRPVHSLVVRRSQLDPPAP